MTKPLETLSHLNGTWSVLVVNTDPNFGAAVTYYLRDQGWQVRHVNDARETLDRWPELAPQLVVTDLEGSNMDGFEFLDSLCALSVRPRVLAISPPLAAMSFDAAALAELGIDAVLERPCRLDAVEKTLAALRAQAQPTPDLVLVEDTAGLAARADARRESLGAATTVGPRPSLGLASSNPPGLNSSARIPQAGVPQ